MKVGILTHSVSRRGGGLFDAVRRLSQTLHGFPGTEIHVFGTGDGAVDDDLPAWAPVPLSVYSVYGPRAFSYAPQLEPGLSAAGLDLLHVHGLWMYASVAGRQWAAKGRPHLVSPHGMLDPWALRNSGWKKRVAGRLYEMSHLRNSACLHALCDAEAQSIRALGLSNPICVIPNGIDLPPPASSKRPADLPADCRILLYLGRLHPKKGLVQLLRAWQSVCRRAAPGASDWHLAIAGWDQGGHAVELKALAVELGIDSAVSFLGPRFGPAKDALFRSSDAFILPSLSEGLPMVVLEAWAYGLPVLMTHACNLPEGFAAGAAIAMSMDCDDLAAQLASMMALPDRERRAVGERGRLLVSERFTWTRTAANMQSVYEWLLGGGERPVCVQ